MRHALVDVNLTRLSRLNIAARLVEVHQLRRQYLYFCTSKASKVSASAARSTTTEPGFIDSIIALEMSFGAGLPGISAVVMMTSTSAACSLVGYGLIHW
jgi:hypothetical protein